MPSRRELANAIRALAMDAVQQARSGHPGMPNGHGGHPRSPVERLSETQAGESRVGDRHFGFSVDNVVKAVMKKHGDE